MRGWILALAAMAGGAPAVAQTITLPISMPIDKGFWINATDKCASVTNGYAYDGKRWGAVYYYGPNASLGPVAELEAIARTTALNDGFITMQLGPTEGVGYFHVKSLGFDRMMLRTGAPGPGGIQVMGDMLIRCSFASLSPRMQSALRRFAPALVAR
jgi:hypothetical protein